MVIIWILIVLFCWTTTAPAAVVLSESDWRALKRQARSNGPTFPTAPVTNDLFLLTNDSAVGACDPTGGIGEVTLCRWTGSVWTAVSGAVSPTVVTLDQAFDAGNEVDNATSARPAIFGNGTQKGKLYGDASEGFVIEPVPLGDSVWRCWTNFNCVIRDMEAAATVFTIDPDAASKNAMYQFGANYRPLKSFFIPAGYLSTDGTQCAAPAESTPIASGAKLFTVICADNDGSRMHASMDMPDDYDGGTILIKPSAVQTAASAGVIEYQAAAQCKGDTETLVATSSYGTEVVWTDTMTGSGAINKATSGAITPSGTCAAGDWLSLYLDIGATNTTTAMSTVHILGFKIIYSSTSLSH